MSEKYVKDLKPGDKTEWYEIVNIRSEAGKVIATVKFNDGGLGERVWDNPNIVITTKSNLFKLEWGINPDREVAIAYGARAIYNTPGTVDLVLDRMCMEGGTEEQRTELSKWLNEYGIPAIKKLTIDEKLSSSETRRVTMQLDSWFIAINPRGSCGYLYIGVYPRDTGDPEFIPAPVPSPISQTSKNKKSKKYR